MTPNCRNLNYQYGKIDLSPPTTLRRQYHHYSRSNLSVRVRTSSCAQGHRRRGPGSAPQCTMRRFGRDELEPRVPFQIAPLNRLSPLEDAHSTGTRPPHAMPHRQLQEPANRTLLQPTSRRTRTAPAFDQLLCVSTKRRRSVTTQRPDIRDERPAPDRHHGPGRHTHIMKQARHHQTNRTPAKAKKRTTATLSWYARLRRMVSTRQLPR